MTDTQEKTFELGFDGGFEAGGKRYAMNTPEEIGILRMVEFNKETIRIAYGQTIADVLAGQVRIRKLLNEQKFYDAIVEHNSQLTRLQDINSDHDGKLMACALFINYEGEDLRQVPTLAERAQKIQDWNYAGVPYSFFVRSLGGFNNTLKVFFDNVSQSSQPSGELAKETPNEALPITSTS